MYKQKVRCAGVHLISGVHLQCLLDLWFRKYSQFIECLLFLTMKGSVPNDMHVGRAVMASFLSLC